MLLITRSRHFQYTSILSGTEERDTPVGSGPMSAVASRAAEAQVGAE